MDTLTRLLGLNYAKKVIGNSLKGYANTGGQLYDIYKGQTGTPEEKLQAGKRFVERQKNIDTTTSDTTLPDILKAALQLGSFAVPFGKGANIATKYLLPGATTGAMQGIATENPTPLSVAGSGAIGAAGAGLIGKTGEIVNKYLGDSLIKGGQYMRDTISKIYQPSSIYGASKEKAIRSALNEMGIRGTPQSQYEKLQPAMEDLGNKISTSLSENPKVVTASSVIDKTLEHLKSALRTKDISSTAAKDEALGYLSDLRNLTTGEESSINTSDLFALKKLVNQDFGSIAKKLDKGTPLNSREKVVSGVRAALDEIIAKEHPEVKDATRLQSYLYDAAPSLGANRKTVPTYRMAGFTLPAGIIQNFQENAGRLLQTSGNTINRVASDKNMQHLAKAFSLLGSGVFNTISNPASSPQDQENSPSQTNQRNGSQNNIQQNPQHMPTIIPNSNQNMQSFDPNEPITLLDGTKSTMGELHKNGAFQSPEAQSKQNMISDDQFKKLFIADLLQNGGRNLDKLSMLQKLMNPQPSIDERIKEAQLKRMENQASGKKVLSDNAVTQLSDFDNSSALMQNLSKDLTKNADITGPIIGRIGSNNVYDTRAQALQSKIEAAVQIVGKAMEGGVLRAEDVPKYRKILPNIQDTPQVAQAKINNVIQLLQQQKKIREAAFMQRGGAPETDQLFQMLGVQ